MEELTNVLSQLAEKLGTTTEYLWSVLIKQAPISALTTLFQMVLFVVVGIILFKIHKWLCQTPEGNYNSRYDDYEELAVIPMLLAGIGYIIVMIILFFCISDVVNGFFNPEYWALKEILGKI